MTRLSEKEISKQEHLTKERLEQLTSGYTTYKNRPEGSFVELMQWSKWVIQKESKTDAEGLIPFVHNKISIDGTFLQFADESKTVVKTLHSDGVTSWESDHGDEHFVGIGIFEIQVQDLKFYHCGLFHKGNQNEDEVSFFILIQKEYVEGYIKFRNDFEKWQKQRERDTQEIEVIGGSPIPYSQDLSWNDIFLPDDLKKKIITTVEGFLNSKSTYERLKVPWRRGIGFWGERGCGKTSVLRLLMSEYKEFKPVTIQPGHSSPDELLDDAFEYAEEHAPSLLFFEDLQEMIRTVDARHFLQLLDGLEKRDGILTVVTGNDFSSLEENLKSRPRRFDRFFEFPLPDIEQSKRYLTKYFGDILSSDIIDNISKRTVKAKFTYAHLQEVYFNAVFIAIPEGREVPNEKDVLLSLEQVSEEKKSADADFLTAKRDLTDEDGEELF